MLLGLRVILKTDDGLTQTRTINAGSGFLSQSTKFLHFGLGEFDKANELTIYWPGFKPQTIAGLSAGHYSIRQELEPKTPNRSDVIRNALSPYKKT